jgi:hypothetical protein
MLIGITIGMVLGVILNLWTMHSYKNILVMKANDGTAEYIKGRFYTIKEEGK